MWLVTNPTHYAVALKYEDGKMRAPKVVAKGVDVLAAKIRGGWQRKMTCHCWKRLRWRVCFIVMRKLDEEIPEMLYVAVAEVLAYVFQLRTYRKQGGMAPDAPGGNLCSAASRSTEYDDEQNSS